ncbi:MAG: hypothetical protein I8H91_06485 [Burkholderiales bacterium]|nr:hypothetical protein [Burkholderiales bacterium]
MAGDSAALALMPDDSKTRLKGKSCGIKKVAWRPEPQRIIDEFMPGFARLAMVTLTLMLPRDEE